MNVGCKCELGNPSYFNKPRFHNRAIDSNTVLSKTDGLSSVCHWCLALGSHPVDGAEISLSLLETPAGSSTFSPGSGVDQQSVHPILVTKMSGRFSKLKSEICLFSWGVRSRCDESDLFNTSSMERGATVFSAVFQISWLMYNRTVVAYFITVLAQAFPLSDDPLMFVLIMPSPGQWPFDVLLDHYCQPIYLSVNTLGKEKCPSYEFLTCYNPVSFPQLRWWGYPLLGHSHGTPCTDHVHPRFTKKHSKILTHANSQARGTAPWPFSRSACCNAIFVGITQSTIVGPNCGCFILIISCTPVKFCECILHGCVPNVLTKICP